MIRSILLFFLIIHFLLNLLMNEKLIQILELEIEQNILIFFQKIR